MPSCLLVSGGYIHRWHRASKTWTSALNVYQTGHWAQSVRIYQKAYPMFHRKGAFLMNYGKALSMVRRNSQAVRILRKAARYRNSIIVQIALGDNYKRLGKYYKAERAYRLAAAMIPNHFYAPYLLAKLYVATGQRGKAVSLAKKLLEKPVKIKSPAVRQIKRKLRKFLTREGWKNG